MDSERVAEIPRNSAGNTIFFGLSQKRLESRWEISAPCWLITDTEFLHGTAKKRAKRRSGEVRFIRQNAIIKYGHFSVLCPLVDRTGSRERTWRRRPPVVTRQHAHPSPPAVFYCFTVTDIKPSFTWNTTVPILLMLALWANITKSEWQSSF